MKCCKCKWKNATSRVKNGDHLILKKANVKEQSVGKGSFLVFNASLFPSSLL